MISMQWPQNLRTLPQPLRKCFCLHYFAAKFMIWNWKLIWRSKKDQKVKFCNYDFYESLLWLYQITYLVPTYLVLAQFKKQCICIFSTTKPSLLHIIHIERATNQSKQKALPRTDPCVHGGRLRLLPLRCYCGRLLAGGGRLLQLENDLSWSVSGFRVFVTTKVKLETFTDYYPINLSTMSLN